MGAWVDDRFAEEEVPINQGLRRRRKASCILGHVCDGGDPGEKEEKNRKQKGGKQDRGYTIDYIIQGLTNVKLLEDCA
ncbi:hypothetical protein ANTRET_LOCUS10087 [Anthophora retusa]